MPRVHQAQVGHSFWASLRRGAGAWPVLVWAATLTGILVMSGGLSVFAGDSAGGGLTIATLVNLRDQKLALPACAVAISPWVDLDGVGTSMTAQIGRAHV